MPENQQLKQVIEYLKKNKIIYNQQDFVEKIGSYSSVVSEYISGKRPISEKFVRKICSAFPILDDGWLMTGKGEMLLKEPRTANNSAKTGKPTLQEDIVIIPLLPIYAQGGSLNDFFVSVRDIDCEHIISPIRGVDFAITVSGESMSPEFPNGSKILIKKINEKAFIEWGRVYVLDTCNGTVVKTLEHSDKEGSVLCTSLNPDPKFAPFFVNTEDIIGMYRVMMCMTVK